MENSFDHLLLNIDSFIKKYYFDKLIRGFIYFLLGAMISYFLTISLEYFFEFSSDFRFILFYTYLLFNTVLLIFNILIPWLLMSKLMKGLNRENAALIIGKYFSEINDKLINTLQLKMNKNQESTDLIEASIKQKIESINSIPFSTAIVLSKNFKLLPYVLVILLSFMVTYFVSPNFILEPTDRIINYSKDYRPFYFEYNDSEKRIEEGGSVTIEVKLVGNKIPNEVFIESSKGKFLMKKVKRNVFSYTFNKIKKDISFKFNSQEYFSDEFKIKVYGKSKVSKCDLNIYYPNYLNLPNKKLKNFGNIQLPEGSKIAFEISTRNTKNNKLLIDDDVLNTNQLSKYKKEIKKDLIVKLIYENSFSSKRDSLINEIKVIKDLFPIISVAEEIDTLSKTKRYFNGEIEDDYGLTGLFFQYKVNNEKVTKIKVKPIANVSKSKFQFAVDFSNISLKPEDKVSYWFTVFDNDGVNGSKSTNSVKKEYIVPSLSEIIKEREVEQEEITTKLDELKNKTNDLDKKIKQLNKELFEKNGNKWNNSEKIKQLKEEYRKIKEELSNSKQKLRESLENKNKLSEIDKELLEKQELLDEMMDEMMDEEMEKLLEELEELMKNENQEELKDKMEELKMTNEEMKQRLDRSLELLKRNRVNEQIDDLEKKLKELSKKQEELINQDSKKTEEKLSKQKEIKKEFKKVKEDFENLKKNNEELNQPLEMESPEEKMEEIEKKMDEAEENLQEGKTKKAKSSQKSSSEKMEELAEQLNAMQGKANQKQNEEDMRAIRVLLQNILDLSVNQESLMIDMNKISSRNPSLQIKGRVQKKISNDSEMIVDSLLQLAKRQPSIASFIDKEVEVLNKNFPTAIRGIGNRDKKEISRSQQKIMTSFNNLALLLDEALQSMQNQMQSQMEGSGQCKNPGSGRPKPNPGGMGDMKEMLKKQLEQLKKGQSQGGKQNGEKQGNIPGLGNKEIAKMAAEQSAIRKKIEEIRNNLKDKNNKLGNNLGELLKELEKQEKDLVNKKFNQVLNRQNEILTRLLESEKALNERGLEEKRESKTSKKENQGNNLRIDEYNKEKNKTIEDIRSIDPRLKKYYKEKATEYLNN